MEVEFILRTSIDRIKSDVAEWALSADKNRLYSMSEVVFHIYGVKYPSDEFARVAPDAADVLRACGFKRIYRNNRRFWVMTGVNEK